MHHSSPAGRRSSLNNRTSYSNMARYSAGHPSPSIGKSPRNQRQDRRIRELCADLKPILGIEPTPVFFTDERTHSFEKFKEAYQELQFFYCAIIRVVQGKDERQLQSEDDLSLVSDVVPNANGPAFDLYHGTKLYRLLCQALFDLRLKPIPSFLECGNPSPSWLVRIAERLIEWYTIFEKAAQEERRVNARQHSVRSELEQKRQQLENLKAKNLELAVSGNRGVDEHFAAVTKDKERLRDEIAETYKALQAKNNICAESERKHRDLQDRVSNLEHRKIELQSAVETLHSNVVKSPGRCIKELETYRVKLAREQEQLANDKLTKEAMLPMLTITENTTKATTSALNAVQNYLAIREKIEELDERKMKLEKHHTDERSSYDALHTELARADADSKQAYDRINSDIDKLKACRRESEAEYERVSKALADARMAQKSAQASIETHRKSYTFKVHQLESLKKTNLLERNEAVTVLEDVLSKLEESKKDQMKLFEERFNFHKMVWTDFKQQVQTACVSPSDDEPEYTDGGDENLLAEELAPLTTIGSRKSVDSSILECEQPIRHRRRSSVLAMEQCQKAIASSDPGQTNQNESLAQASMKLTANERSEILKAYFLKRVEMAVTGQGLTVEELEYRSQLPKVVRSVMQEFLDMHNDEDCG